MTPVQRSRSTRRGALVRYTLTRSLAQARACVSVRLSVPVSAFVLVLLTAHWPAQASGPTVSGVSVASSAGSAAAVTVTVTESDTHHPRHPHRDEGPSTTSSEGVAARSESNTTGKPRIEGTPKAGHVLTADTSGMVFPAGITSADLLYQWSIALEGSRQGIPGATGRTYRLTGDEIGKSLVVTVAFIDGGGIPTNVTSEPTLEIATAWPYEEAQVPFNMAQITWRWWADERCAASDERFSALTIDFTIHNSHDYSGARGLFLGLASGSMADTVGFYFGLQTELLPPDGTLGKKGALFVRWQTQDLADAAANPEQGWALASANEGDAVSVRRSYEWSAGDYRARIAPDTTRGTTEAGAWYGLWITDLDTAVETWIGSLRFPLVEVRTFIPGSIITFVEVYGPRLVTPIEVPSWHVSVGPPAGATGDDSQAAVCGVSSYPPVEDVTSNARYDDGDGRIHFEVFGTTSRRNDAGHMFFLGPQQAGVVDLSPDTPRVGDRVTARLSDPNGSANEQWQWARGTGLGGFRDIDGATESSYTPMPADVGSLLRASVVYDDGYGPQHQAEAVSLDVVREAVTNRAPAFVRSVVRLVLDATLPPGSVLGSVLATDPDEDLLTYRLSGPDAVYFAIDPATGEVSTAEPTTFDLATRSEYRMRVHVDDGRSGTDEAEVVVTVTERPVLPPITTGGGGGGGGPTGPTPSDVDFEWTVKHDIEQLDGGHETPSGAWSDGSTFWLLQNGSGADDGVYAYDLASGARLEAREFALREQNRAPRGVWSNGETMWVSDSGQDRLFAHDLASGERLEAREFELARRNRDARGIWSDGETMWVLDGAKDGLFAYDLESGKFIREYALAEVNSDPRGIWSDGTTVWVADHGAKRLFAYRLPALPADAPPDEHLALDRVPDEDFAEPGRVGNNSPRGLWSDGAVIYVADANDSRVYSYNMPDAIDARLASLALTAVDIGEFEPGRTDYQGAISGGVTETVVTAEAMQPRAEVAIDPPDADGDESNGHQAALAGVRAITVTVTSADGTRQNVYRVSLEPAEDEPWPRCLRGDIAVGFSLVLYEGGSVEELAACAQSRDVATLYTLHEGVYVAYILGAPDFVNQRFRELYTDGVPAFTTLVASSTGPPSDDPVGELSAPRSWPHCLRGEIADGFSLVLYEGGSVDDLAACASSLGVTAVYALTDGEWVSYIPGAPGVVNRAFRELFPDGVPAVVPLLVSK